MGEHMSSLGWLVGGPLVYFAVGLFLVKTALLVKKYLDMPRHIRWDLYPVPHNGAHGSKYQKVDFAENKHHNSLMHELWDMGQEILFIKKAYINNPKIWFGSFPLHMGLYLGITWLLLLIAGALLQLNGGFVGPNTNSVLTSFVYYATLFTGVGSFVAGLLGALVLLIQRLTDEGMIFMSDVVSYLNLAVMIMLFGTGLAAWMTVDSTFAEMRYQMSTLISFRFVPVKETLVMLHILTLCTFLIYLPFSRMMHFVGKYFFYHNIMWDDEGMKKGSAMENDFASYLQYKTTWSAPHIRKGESWGEQVAKGSPQEGGKK
jgi:nitrate reductase gamma subunit